MRRFILKAILHLLLVPIFFLGLLIFLHNSTDINNTSNVNKPIFIWGDSQAYQGLNLNILRRELKREVFTAATHGAGIYDFLIFSENVPDSSEVLIALSKPVQLRRKKKDRNKSGLSFSALIRLKENNYSTTELISIITRNLKPVKLFKSNTLLYSYSDSIINTGEPLSLFKDIYSEIPDYLKDKQNLYLEGIRQLNNKECKVSFIEFPYHKKLKIIERESDVFKETEDFKRKVSSLFINFNIDTINIDKNHQHMHDLTHLNEYGASELSYKLSLELLKNDSTTLYIAH